MLMFVVVDDNSRESKAFFTKAEVEAHLEERLNKRKLSGAYLQEPIGGNHMRVSLGGTTYYFVYKCEVSLKTGDALRDFAAAAFEKDGPERDAIRDVIKGG